MLSAMLLAGIALGVLPAGARADEGDEMQWSVTPYLWATKTTVDLSFRDQNIGSGKISFSDLMDMTDAAFMVHVEGGKGRWSALVDLTYIDISDTDRRQVFTIDSSSEQVYLDAAVAFWPGGVGSNLSLYGGLRYTGLDDEFRFSLSSDGTLVSRQRSDKDYSDALLGARYRWDLSPRWSLLAQGDTSFGGSEGTWQLRGLFAYTVGKRQENRILFGYQYKEAEFKDGDVGIDMTFEGPLAGFNFRF
jgi:hypothetical protein